MESIQGANSEQRQNWRMRGGPITTTKKCREKQSFAVNANEVSFELN